MMSLKMAFLPLGIKPYLKSLAMVLGAYIAIREGIALKASSSCLKWIKEW